MKVIVKRTWVEHVEIELDELTTLVGLSEEQATYVEQEACEIPFDWENAILDGITVYAKEENVSVQFDTLTKTSHL